ncbi:VWA domain-containing protein, partial [Acidimicrobiales bacterium]|nr:VWA domain-containing protein [Acidimicrobiales bacterium]
MADFTAQVFQNEYLPAGGNTVDAVITVNSAQGTETGSSQGLLEVIIVDMSGSMNEDGGAKVRAAKAATAVAIDALDDGVEFAIIAGTDRAMQIYPHTGTATSDPQNRNEAKKTVKRMRADGGTAIGTWLRLAAGIHESRPDLIRHSLLLTDGKNQHESDQVLRASIDACVGLFQCDCRGLGVDWNVDELRLIANALLGTVDIIPSPSEMEAEFERIIANLMKKQVADVALRLWSPKGANIEFLKQVSPNIDDLTPRAIAVDALTDDFPLGAWAGEESRDYHLRVK